ncbi:hypothetical protein PF023_10060 [Enterococcus thailandicus]|uniref:hypothetical protein n=1 Tax=Enterococcus thailandicus TaxID=417368 RepID=UPI0022EC03DD|nr:hypothetical protein [Enterococcus thailandicus]MDA3974392.1 hypothetical protein [Enterococcus thailandicus]MDA3976879.1 hypothetical protein [Enterococcus thailandicus]MDA3981845.1 hypothetical protein [Enterococcus thailandicus]
MKKMSPILLSTALALLLVGCSPKQSHTKKAASKPNLSITTKSSAASSSTTISTTKNSSASTTSGSSTQVTSSQVESQTSELAVTSTSEQPLTDTSSSQVTQADSLAGYSDLQIEYARVWLTFMGSNIPDDFELHVQLSPAGQPIDPYDNGSLTYPTETVTLSGKYSYQGLVVYASNHDGTVTRYPTPSHWQMPADQASDPEAIRALTQNVLDQATVVPIPTGDSEQVKRLIAVTVID